MGTYKYDKLKSQNKLSCILTIAFYNHIFLKGVCVWSCTHSQIKLTVVVFPGFMNSSGKSNTC